MSACVDLENLREITGGDRTAERELFQLFLESSTACIAALKACAGGSQIEEWRKEAHAFKGTSLNLGADELGRLCRDAQENFQAPAETKLALLAAIESEFGRVKDYLEKAAEA